MQRKTLDAYNQGSHNDGIGSEVDGGIFGMGEGELSTMDGLETRYGIG